MYRIGDLIKVKNNFKLYLIVGINGDEYSVVYIHSKPNGYNTIKIKESEIEEVIDHF